MANIIPEHQKKFDNIIEQIHIITTQEIGRVRHRRINIEEATGTSYTDGIIIVMTMRGEYRWTIEYQN